MSEQYTIDNRFHGFNVGIAIDYSPTISLWIGHLAHWSEKNLANEKHIYDGHVWCYDTLDAIAEYFPYMSKRQIETMINNSVSAGLVIKGNYNQTQYDRTCWYALTPKAFDYYQHLSSEKNINRLFSSISHNCEMDIAEWGNRFTHFVTPIPNTTPYTDPNTNHHSPPKSDTVAVNKKQGKKKITHELKVKLIDIYHEVFPNNPRHMTKVIAGDLDKVLTKFINKDYKMISKSGSEVNEENFRTLLLAMKERAPNWTMSSYTTPAGRSVTNSLVNFLRFDNITRFMEGRMT